MDAIRFSFSKSSDKRPARVFSFDTFWLNNFTKEIDTRKDNDLLRIN
jgi:hypothetical protein